MPQQIPLNKGKRGYALVSDRDYARVSQHNWQLDGNGYVVSKMTVTLPDGTRELRKVLLHRFILNAPDHLEVDHRFGNKLDNRRSQIRLATKAQNNANRGPQRNKSCPYKGVFYHARDMVWRASIIVEGRNRHLGTFRCPEQAARAYDIAALEAWGEFAYLNFPHLRPLYQLALSISHIWRARPRVVCLTQ
jgi:hypothetical protein